jgi:hypothetical protein
MRDQRIFQILDDHLERWSAKLRDDVGLCGPDSQAPCQAIRKDVNGLAPDKFMSVLDNDLMKLVSLEERAHMYMSWHAWKKSLVVLGDSRFRRTEIPRHILDYGWDRMVWVVDFYMGVVFSSESLMDVLRNACAHNSATFRIFNFLRSGQARNLRNAFAHGNWEMEEDELRFWAKLGESEQITCFRMKVIDAEFYSQFTRCVTWAAIEAVLLRSEAAGNTPG